MSTLPASSNAIAAKPRALRIFLVENHADTLKYMRLYLEQLGHHVEVARDCREALAALPGFDCQVFISDIGLPDGNGWDLLREAHLSEVYSIAMSGFGMNSDRGKSQAAGYRHHLLKPFIPDELDRILEEAARELEGR